MPYVIPDFDKPLKTEELERLKKYCINAGTFVLTRYFYSEKALRDFFTFKKRIPNRVDAVNDKGEKESVPLLEEVVDELRAQGVIDDKKYAHAKAESCLVFRGKSERATRAYLLEKGFTANDTDEAIDKVVSDSAYDDDDAIKRAAGKIVRSPSFIKKDTTNRHKTFVRKLVSQGFELSDILNLVNDGFLTEDLYNEE